MKVYLLQNLLTLCMASPAAAATPTPSTPWLEGLVEQARTLAAERVKPDSPEEQKWKARIKSTVDDILDWDELTRQSLGSEWTKTGETDRAEFQKLLREMIEASYMSKLRLRPKSAAEDPKVEVKWLAEDTKGDRSKATAEVKAGKTKTTLEFHMKWLGDKWRVYDVAIDEVGTVRTYRSQFRKIIAEQGFPKLLDRMRQKTEEIRKGLADLSAKPDELK
ncbi:MAG: ABC transporter substrate-binding protein [Deltaproteobacteria bacterium]|nr:ABC transporter substrate-binding protein [Deltaproteobacteria bacterium]